MCESCHNRDIWDVCMCVCVYRLWKPPTVCQSSEPQREEGDTRAQARNIVWERERAA